MKAIRSSATRTIMLSVDVFAAVAILVAINLLAAGSTHAGPAANPSHPLGTNAGGVITQSTTWALVNRPYNVTSKLIVTTGITLTIEPGVMVMSGDGIEIQVLGNLMASGTIAQPITLTRYSSTLGRWINAGLSDDIDGDPRPMPAGSAPDLGADESPYILLYMPMVRKP